jgi:hypothetical protein
LNGGVGAVLLLLAFVFQLTAAIAPSDRTTPLPGALASWGCLLLAVLVPVSLASLLAYKLLFRATFGRVLALEAARQEEDKRAAESAKATA